MMPWSPAPSSLLSRGVDALGNVGRLRVQQHFDLGVAPVEALLLIADVLDGVARHCFHFLAGRRIWDRGFRRR